MKNVKKIIGFLCCLVFCAVMAAGVTQVASAAEEIAINETNFPDEIFRDYITGNFDKDKDGRLSEKEINEVTMIGVGGKGIKSLKGVEYFSALKDLSCYSNQLTVLDVSKNTALQQLQCSSNQLVELHINKDLQILNCNFNRLTNLDVSKSIFLYWLYCSGNQLTVLDVSKNIGLTELDCYSNQLTALDVSENTVLQELDCGYNQLITLDISENIALIKLHCCGNQLTVLNAGGSIALQELHCQDNQLVKLDISKNIALKELYCCGNQLESLDTSKNIALTRLECGSDEVNGYDGNQLTALDVSKNIALTELDCSSNQLTDLDISKNTALTELDCSNNKLTSLDVSKNTALTSLYCFDNKLTKLDVSKNTILTSLSCSDNKLTKLDVSKNTVLMGLDCYNNPILGLKLNSHTYGKLRLYSSGLHGLHVDLSGLQNATKVKAGTAKDDSDIFLIEVTDITKPATYKVDGKDFFIIYEDIPTAPLPGPSITPSPSSGPVVQSDAHIFSDYNHNNPVTGPAVVIYGNGRTQTVDGKKVNNREFTAYTDILASYKYTLNSKGIVKPSVGKVIVGVTKSNIKPEVSSKNKITDTSASKIARAKIKNGQITVTAVGKEDGIVYLWVIDTGNKGVFACCPIDVKLAPTKLEVQDKSGSKLVRNTKLENGKTLEVSITGFAGSTETKDGTYTATVASKYQGYVTVAPVEGSTNQFVVNAIGLKDNKDTKVTITFQCGQNGKKTNLFLTIVK
ncbi:MAG: hypothetical protein HFH68_13900 [Lachnospiraceae bacterium]|nr:hypothetical protein [Lachnospiraceae bacterium]